MGKMRGVFAAASLAGATLVASTGMAQATLFDRGNGMIYDSVLNITWLQDATYARASKYDSVGLFTWNDAETWVNQLVYQGISGWRLPNIAPVNGVGGN